MGDDVGALTVFHSRARSSARKEILKALAENPNARLVLFGWSWGGASSVKLARDLDKRGIKVHTLFLIDPVTLGRWLSNDIPENVENFFNYYQTAYMFKGERFRTDEGTSSVQKNLNVNKGENRVIIDGQEKDTDHATILWTVEPIFKKGIEDAKED